jgi:hypothetical protein
VSLPTARAVGVIKPTARTMVTGARRIGVLTIP